MADNKDGHEEFMRQIMEIERRKKETPAKYVELDKVPEGFHAYFCQKAVGGCGYVGIPEKHPLYGCHYSTFKSVKDGKATMTEKQEKLLKSVRIHGGLTYAEKGSETRKLEKPHLWYFGWDANHAFLEEQLANRSLGIPVTYDLFVTQTRFLLFQLVRMMP